MRERNWKVRVEGGCEWVKKEERRVGRNGLVVVWLNVKDGELVEKRYVEYRGEWWEYEKWLRVKEYREDGVRGKVMVMKKEDVKDRRKKGLIELWRKDGYEVRLE